MQTLINGGFSGLKLYFGYYAGLIKYKFHRLRLWLLKRRMQARYGELLKNSNRMEAINTNASRSYVPEAYSGKVHLFFASEQARFKNDNTHNGWDKINLERLIIHPLACYHGNLLFEPFVAQVAEILNHQLAR